MAYISYERLKGITETEKPYRGFTNRYPVGSRKQNKKYFLAVEENGETVFDVVYGERWEYIELTKAQYESALLAGDKRAKSHASWNNPNEMVHYTHKVTPHIMGRVRPDNTFEFTSPISYGQGGNMILGEWLGMAQATSSKHGGAFIRANWRDEPFHPVFQGLRINLDTKLAHESCQYKVTSMRVNRTESKKFLTRYADMYKTCETMFKVMGFKSFLDIMADVATELEIDLENWCMKTEDYNNLVAKAEKEIDTAPLDALACFALAYDVSNMFRRVRSVVKNEQYWLRDVDSVDMTAMFESIKRKVNKELYKANPQVMTPIEFGCNTAYPASEWGTVVTLNGSPVKRYH